MAFCKMLYYYNYHISYRAQNEAACPFQDTSVENVVMLLVL